MPTLADLPVLKVRLAEAELALHKLATGAQTASAGYEGKSATFTQADYEKLERYIAKLKAEIGALEGDRRRRLAPIHLVF